MTTETTPLVDRAGELLGQLAGPDARLRPDQVAAIEAVAGERRRALVVQRTGFGKSAIYFIATRLLRDAGAGPTLVVSPLLALMRDQVAAAERMGVRSATINSTNPDDWAAIEASLAAGEIDLLCSQPRAAQQPPASPAGCCPASPGASACSSSTRRTASPTGATTSGPTTAASATPSPTWRPARRCWPPPPPPTPGSAPTSPSSSATTCSCCGARSTASRCTSAWPGSARFAERLAWVAERIPDVDGTGHRLLPDGGPDRPGGRVPAGRRASTPAPTRPTRHPRSASALEAAFKANGVKALVATSALGMGVDKPDVTFVFHLGAPPSPIAYYQQVGRAGRSVARAEAWLLPGPEDQRIWDWFASVGLPPEPLVQRVLDAMSDDPGAPVEPAGPRSGRRPAPGPARDAAQDPRRRRRGRAGRRAAWVRTGAPWVYDRERVARIQAARDAEAEAMVAYAGTDRCLMEFLRSALDDPAATPCGRCINCTGTPAPTTARPGGGQPRPSSICGASTWCSSRGGRGPGACQRRRATSSPPPGPRRAGPCAASATPAGGRPSRRSLPLARATTAKKAAPGTRSSPA